LGKSTNDWGIYGDSAGVYILYIYKVCHKGYIYITKNPMGETHIFFRHGPLESLRSVCVWGQNPDSEKDPEVWITWNTTGSKEANSLLLKIP